MRVDPALYQRLELRVHALLAEVPLHDVWAVDLPGDGPAPSLVELRALLSLEEFGRASRTVALLFALRRGLGRVFGWDRERGGASAPSFLERLSPAEREASLVPPGTPDGPFRVLYVLPREAVSEVRNATVHAFSAFALEARPDGDRLYWAIYVRPVGRITSWYMAAIDPFRRHVVYPAVLRQIRASWERRSSRAASSR